jgi:hypothetical protein
MTVSRRFGPRWTRRLRVMLIGRRHNWRMSGCQKSGPDWITARVRKRDDPVLGTQYDERDVPILSSIKIGSYTRVMANEAKWRRRDQFPSHQRLADELEKLLRFADELDCFEPLLLRLRGDARDRSAVLGELLAAFYLRRRGFTILGRDPVGRSGKVGDWSADFRGGTPLFVEVKAPDWEAELSEDERKQGRKTLGKYVDLEARSVAPFDVLMDVIGRNATPKLLPGTPNLIVTSDNLFVSIVGMPYLEPRFREWFARPQFRAVGGILFLRHDESLDPDRVRIRFEENKFADQGNQLPADVISHLQAQAAIDDRGRRDNIPGPLSRRSRIILG